MGCFCELEFFEENGPKVTRSGFVFCVFFVNGMSANDKNCWGFGFGGLGLG